MAQNGKSKNKPFEIIADNPEFLVINKSAGINVHPPEGDKGQEKSLIDYIVKDFPSIKKVGEKDRPGIVHRLDRNTTGLILIAKNQKTYDILQTFFRQRQIQKTYLALVWGKPEMNTFSLQSYVGRSDKDRTKFKTSFIEGKRAITEGKLSETFIYDSQIISLLELHPHTGRTHQLRVQLKSFGMPILGDDKYNTKPSKRVSKKLGIQRQMLHAYKIEFELGNKKYNFTAEISNDFQKILNNLQKSK